MSKPWAEGEVDWEHKAFPAGIDIWSRSVANAGVDANGKFIDIDHEDYESSLDYPGEVNLMNAVKLAWENAFESNASDGYDWTNVNWSGVGNYQVPPVFDSIEDVIENLVQQLGELDGVSGKVQAHIQSFADEAPDGKEQWISVNEKTDWYDPVATAPTVTGTWDIWPSALSPDWSGIDLDPEEVDWDNESVIDVLREFAMELLSESETEDIVAEYAARLADDADKVHHSNVTHLYFAGAMNTSPAAMATYRLAQSKLRMTAAFRAELLYRMLPDSSSTANVFSTFVQDAHRRDNYKLSLLQLYLSSKGDEIAANIRVALENASNSTAVSLAQMNAKLGADELKLQGTNLRNNAELALEELKLRDIVEKNANTVRMSLSALEASLRASLTDEGEVLDIFRMLLQLRGVWIDMKYKYIDSMIQLRREMQVNRLKGDMWRIEIAETMMQASQVPLGIPMRPPDPSMFETRLASSIQTFTGVAGAMAGSGPAAALTFGTLAALGVAFLPRNPGGN